MHRTHYIKDARKVVSGTVQIAGWVHDVRDLGKMKFVLVRDITGIMQVIMKKGAVPEERLEAVKVNKEDVVSFTGTIKENKMAPDGAEMVPSSFEHLNKVERKLPVDPTGVVPSELDTRLDNRFIDLRRKEASVIFRTKSLVAGSF